MKLLLIFILTLLSFNTFADSCPTPNANLLDYLHQFQLCLEGIDNCESAGVSQEEARNIVKEACGSKEARLEEVRCQNTLIDLRCSRI
jgi:hypothetical protein